MEEAAVLPVAHDRNAALDVRLMRLKGFRRGREDDPILRGRVWACGKSASALTY